MKKTWLTLNFALVITAVNTSVTVERKLIFAATAYMLPWKHLGCNVNCEACHKNQLWHDSEWNNSDYGDSSIKQSVCTVVSREKKIMDDSSPRSILKG